MGGPEKTTVDKIKDVLEEAGLLKQKSLPRIHPDNEWYKHLPHKIFDGVKQYYITNKDGTGDWYIEAQVKVWFFQDQFESYSRECEKWEAEIRKYEDEIDRIDEEISQAQYENQRKDLQRSVVLDEIAKKDETLRQKKAQGALDTDTDVQALRAELEKLQEDLEKIETGDLIVHIKDWPKEPGGVVEKDQDLYIIRHSHRLKIKKIKGRELADAEEQRDRSAYHYQKWEEKLEEYVDE